MYVSEEHGWKIPGYLGPAWNIVVGGRGQEGGWAKKEAGQLDQASPQQDLPGL